MQGRHLAPGERHGSPAALRKADRRRLVELIRPKAQRMTQRLIDDVFDALNEQTVTVHSTKVRARARGPLRQLTDPCPYRFCPVVLLPGQAQMEGVRIPVRLPDAVQSRLVADAAPRRIVASAPGQGDTWALSARLDAEARLGGSLHPTAPCQAEGMSEGRMSGWR